jgi:molybdopterin-binding protein
MSNTNAISVPIPASTTAAYVGHFSAVTAGTYSVGAALSSSVTFNSAGTLSFAAGADSIAIS